MATVAAWIKECFVCAALVLLVIAVLPLVAIVAIVMRPVLMAAFLIAVCGGLVLSIVSPRFRRCSKVRPAGAL